MADSTSIFGREGLRHLAAVSRANRGQAYGIGRQFVDGTPADQRQVLGRDDVRREFQGTRQQDGTELSEEARRFLASPDRT